MGFLGRFFRRITRNHRAKAHGAKGERRVNAALNPFFGKVYHKSISNLILVDDYENSHQIDHVEIRENGIFCIETKYLVGHVIEGEKEGAWTQILYAGERHHIFDPLKQNETHCRQIRRIIGNKYNVNSLIVMANDNSASIKHFNVINLCDLKEYLKNFDDGERLSKEEIDAVYNLLIKSASKMTAEEHKENVHKSLEKIESNICPRCGGKLILKKFKDGTDFYGCENYPRCTFIKK